jgi:predicted aldo/keto reductase-like oxidoreductase
MRRTSQLSEELPEVCRLGLASRGNTHCRPDDVEYAVERGVNYLNWCGKPDGLSKAVAELGERRKDVVVAVQFKASGGEEAAREFDWILREINSDYLDIATFYYVESEGEWETIVGPGGAWEVLAQRKREGALRMIGLTSHQRKLAAKWAEATNPNTGRRRLDMLMIRYNAAHRGAESDLFPTTDDLGTPVVTFTGLRWKDLLVATPDDPEGFVPPTAPECYRFCLANNSVAVALMAAGNREELEENLALMDDWRPPADQAMKSMREHGNRVRKHGRKFW